MDRLRVVEKTGAFKRKRRDMHNKRATKIRQVREGTQLPAPETMRSLGTNSVPVGFWDHLGGRA